MVPHLLSLVLRNVPNFFVQKAWLCTIVILVVGRQKQVDPWGSLGAGLVEGMTLYQKIKWMVS